MSQETQQELLRKAWLEGRDGNLNALGEAKAWALREIWRAEHDDDYGLLPFVAARVSKNGAGDHQPWPWFQSSARCLCALGCVSP